MTKDKKSKPTIHCPPDDPLGVDPDNFDAEARRIARDAIEGRHEEAVQVEARAAHRRWGMTSKSELVAKAVDR
ncbi:hypothetical protein [Sinorhizobium meliloti]